MFGHYESFFIASTGAAAAFLGLLFVGFTVVDSGESDPGTRERRTVLAGSAFMALADAFFVSILALTGVSPDTAEMVIVTPQGSGKFTVAGRLTAHGR